MSTIYEYRCKKCYGYTTSVDEPTSQCPHCGWYALRKVGEHLTKPVTVWNDYIRKLREKIRENPLPKGE